MAQMFSKRHYALVAEILKDKRTDFGPGIAQDVIQSIALRFARVFQADSERFDRERFLIAAGAQVTP